MVVGKRDKLAARQQRYAKGLSASNSAGVVAVIATFLTNGPVGPISIITCGLVGLLCVKMGQIAGRRKDALLTDKEISDLQRAILTAQSELNKLMRRKDVALYKGAYERCDELHEHLRILRDKLGDGDEVNRAEFVGQVEGLAKSLKKAKSAASRAKRKK